MPVFMEEAEAASADGGGTTLGSVDFDVGTKWDVDGVVRRHRGAPPPPPRSFGMSRIRRRGGQNL